MARRNLKQEHKRNRKHPYKLNPATGEYIPKPYGSRHIAPYPLPVHRRGMRGIS